MWGETWGLPWAIAAALADAPVPPEPELVGGEVIAVVARQTLFVVEARRVVVDVVARPTVFEVT